MNKDTQPIGFDVLFNPALNKGTAFTEEERDKYKLRGLLPPRVTDPDVQLHRALENMRRKYYDIERYIFLSALQSRNERLYYRAIMEHIEEIMPLIYTPTVGQACKEFAAIFRQPKGIYITAEDRGNVRSILANWLEQDVRVIVVTDGERILGLGDLGANGMGIPIGKLALYVACAGIHPHQCLPIMLDVGTNNEELLNDPLYLGINQHRLTGDEYDSLIDEFIQAAQDAYPKALIQFEDFLTPNAYRLLNKYRDQILCFNDDIQGTAAVALAGVYASIRISDLNFSGLRIMFLGAGSAATGIADLITYALQQEGLSAAEARQRLWFVDIAGLVVKNRNDLMQHNLPYAHDHPPADFITAIKQLKPHILIGATGFPGTFTQEVVELMAEINDRPALFALSNPTSRAECTAQQAYEWTNGQAIFTSGSPFAEVVLKGKTFKPGQGNNVYIFPGIGLGSIMSGASRISEDMFLVAAQKLASLVSEERLSEGAIYPPISDIRSVSLDIATAVAEKSVEQNLACLPESIDLKQAIANYMYDPRY
ncbi:MAG: NAD-dependent malic enzyme [Gammaproteobacteria bacterium]|nr:NAD-dependent malic enzyme [Gammaproteobacteria bacterium]